MPRPRVVTFAIMPSPKWGKVQVLVSEPGQAGGEFTVSSEAWERVRHAFTPGPGVRVREYPPWPLMDG